METDVSFLGDRYDMANPIQDTSSIHEALVMVIAGLQFLVFFSGFFIRSFFKRIEDDIKELFNMRNNQMKDCANHGERLAHVEAKLNGKPK